MGEQNFITSPSEKWQIDINQSGFSVFPNHVFTINKFLESHRRLSATEQLLILNLLTWWWHREAQPFPSKATLAARLGLSARQIQRSIKCLQQKGMLAVTARYDGGKRRTNFYDLSMFVETVRFHAESALAVK